LTDRLADTAGPLRLTWPELDELVGGLPASAAKHRAWWSGDRAHVRAWRAAGFTVEQLVLNHEVTFVRADRSAGHIWQGEVEQRAAEISEHPADGQVLLVACVKSKVAQPAAAKDLYASPLFTRERRYAENRGVPWFVLSAEYGLVAPDEWVSPYERYLPDMTASYRAAWGQWVAERLELLVGPLADMTIEVHAGAAYLDAISVPLTAKGAELLTPLAGLSMGRRLSWYDEHIAPDPPVDLPSVDDGEAASFTNMLLDRSQAVTPSEFLASRRRDLAKPGLYSWWVDEPGAADLSGGLGLPIQPGLIYAGLAGATRWPSGQPSRNSLWSRIADMHLRGRREFSTFRRSLGSILATADGHPAIDESAVTEWMMRHLRVRAAPYDDPDTLGRLETAVLRAIDPPLNLKGMPESPIRARLQQLRRKFGRMG
jgi:hypothetical protein